MSAMTQTPEHGAGIELSPERYLRTLRISLTGDVPAVDLLEHLVELSDTPAIRGWLRAPTSKRSLSAGSDVHSRLTRATRPSGRSVVAAGDNDSGMASPRSVGPEAQDRYRCPDRGAPGGQRCQLLVEHDTPAHIASVGGVFRAWVDGAETTLLLSPYGWFVSFPRDESSTLFGELPAPDWVDGWPWGLRRLAHFISSTSGNERWARGGMR
jgi:hypothetical protein